MSEEPKIEVMDAEPKATLIGEEKPTREALKDEGYSAEELEMAEKHGVVKKADDKTGTASEKAGSGRTTEAAPEKKAEQPPVKRTGTVPNFVLDPEKEKQFFELFGPGTEQRAMYVGMKVERQKRQKAEAELEQIRRERLAPPEPKKVEPLKDANGNFVDPDDLPLTPKRLRELAAQEAEARQKQEAEKNQSIQELATAHQEHEEIARATYPDFEETTKLAVELMKNLPTLIPDIKTQKRAIRLIQEFQATAANAHKVGPDDFTEADLAYEIGRLHPNYGKESSDGEEPIIDDNPAVEPKKATGSQIPETLKRIEKNTQRRASSAAIPATGRRTVTADEVTIDHLLKMSPERLQDFREKHPAQYEKLRNG